MTTATTHNYKVLFALNEKLPIEMVREIFGFGITNDHQKLQFLINRFRTYEFKGNKRKFGDYIRKNFDGKRWRRYGLTYLVKSRQPTRTITTMNGETYTQKIDGKWNSIQEIVNRLLEANHTDLLPFLIGLEKHMLDNGFIKK